MERKQNAIDQHDGSDDEFFDACEDVNELQQQPIPAFDGESYSSDQNISEGEEEKKPESFNMETAKQFTVTLTNNQAVGPNSFADSKSPPDADCPPPKDIPVSMLLKPLPTKREDILAGLEVNEEGCLVCTDEEMLNQQKGVLPNVAKQLAVNLLKGLSISHISLPIKIFEARSSIQRIVDFWSAAPKYLNAAADCTDPVERMNNVITFSVCSLILCCSQAKPFNPLLGETNQGSFSDGTRYYCEHTSHHPPITHFLIEGPNKKYRMFGYYEFIGKMGKNSLTSGLRGPHTIEFADGSKIRFNAPDFRLGGTMVGDRTIEGVGTIVHEDLANLIKSVTILGTFEKAGFFGKKASGNKSDFTGIVYQQKPEKAEATAFGKNQKLPEDLAKLKDLKSKYADFSGNYLRILVINGKTYWDFDDHDVTRQIPQLVSDKQNCGIVLPSDWRYREDLIWLKYGYQKIAANWKLKLEVQQRKDRKNRQEAEKARKDN